MKARTFAGGCARDGWKAKSGKVVTFEQMTERFIASHEAGWRNPKHRQQWRNTLWNYVFPHVGALPMPMSVLQRPLDGTTFWLAPPETASRVRGRCEQIWDAAKAMGLCRSENPFRWRGDLDKLLPTKAKVHKPKHFAAVPNRQLPPLVAALRARTSASAKALELRS